MPCRRLASLSMIAPLLLASGCSLVLPAVGYLADRSSANIRPSEAARDEKYSIRLATGRGIDSGRLAPLAGRPDTFLVSRPTPLPDTTVAARDIHGLQTPVRLRWTLAGLVGGIAIDALIVSNSMQEASDRFGEGFLKMDPNCKEEPNNPNC